jgi:mRNA interferase MazF
VWVSFGNPAGHEQGGSRPALVVSNDVMNHSPADIFIVCPFTTTVRNLYPGEVYFPQNAGGLPQPSILMVPQIRVVARQRIGKQIGLLADPVLRNRIEAALRQILEL